MKGLILGALLGLLLVLCPAFTVALVVGLASQPVVIAFALGLVCRKPLARRFGRWVA